MPRPAVLAFVLAALITLPLADSLFQMPIQVSDSLEAIVASARYRSTSARLRRVVLGPCSCGSIHHAKPAQSRSRARPVGE